jgi:hypothetical protein
VPRTSERLSERYIYFVSERYIYEHMREVEREGEQRSETAILQLYCSFTAALLLLYCSERVSKRRDRGAKDIREVEREVYI